MTQHCDNRSISSSPCCDNRDIICVDNRNYRRMYREWLANRLENAVRGTKARLAQHMGWNSDVVSKILSSTREISAEELPRIASFFDEMPPGFDKLVLKRPIRLEEIPDLLRANGIQERAIDLAMFALERPTVQQSESRDDHDQSERSNRRHEREPSKRQPQRSTS